MNTTKNTIAEGGVFISYARREDEPFVEQLYHDLQQRGIPVWWDQQTMASRGRTFLQEIREALVGINRVLLIVGPRAVISDYVRVEWEFALERCKIVIPVLRLGKEPSAFSNDDYNLVPSKLAKLHCVNFRPNRPYEEALEELLRHLRLPLPTLGTLHSVPTLPPHFITRPQELDVLQSNVLDDLVRPTVITAAQQVTALYGMSGIGKSVLAAAFAQSCAARNAFPDGIVWVTAGQKPDVLALMRAAGRALGDADPQHYSDLATSSEQLRAALEGKACLLILDDIWHLEHAKIFVNALHPESRNRLLLTTRDRQLVNAFGAAELCVEVLSDEQSLQLLSKWSQQAVEQLPGEAHEVRQECGNLPLALAMIGAMVRGKPANRWSNVLHRLRAADLEKIKQQFPNYPYHDLLRAIAVSVKALPRKLQKRYLEFAVFPEDTPIPEATLQTFWQPQGLDEYDTAEILDTLVSRSLVRREEDRTLMLHDLQYDYVRRQHKNLPALHDQFLSAYATRCPHGWHTGPNDGYFFAHLLHHLEAAGRSDEVHRLLATETSEGRNAWFEAKEAMGNLTSYRNDIAQAWRMTNEEAASDGTQSAVAVCGRRARYAVIVATLHSLVSRVPPALLIALVEQNVWSLARGLEYARQATEAKQRGTAMARLMPRIPPADCKDWLHEALKAVRAVGQRFNPTEDDWQTETIIQLISLYPEPKPDAAFQAVLQAIRALPYARLQAQTLIALKSYLPGSRPADAVELARSIKEVMRGERWKEARALALAAYAGLAEPSLRQGMWDEAVLLAQEAEYLSERAEIVASLANNQATVDIPQLLQDYLAAARDAQSFRVKLEVFAKLVAYMSSDQQRQAIREIAAVVHTEYFDYHQMELLSVLAAQLPPELCEELLKAAQRIPHEEWKEWVNGYWREKAIIRVIPHLAAERRSKMVEAAFHVCVSKNPFAKDFDKKYIFDEIIRLAPYLSRRRRQELLTFVNSIQSTSSRLYALRDLIPHLPEDEKEIVLCKAMDTILAEPSSYDRENYLEAFIPLLPVALLKEALAAVTAIGDEGYLIQAFPKLFAHLSAAEKEQALRLTLDVTRQYEWCASVLAELAPALPQPMVSEAFELAQAMQVARNKARLLAGVIPLLTEAEQEVALQQAQEALESDSNDLGNAENWAFLLHSLAPEKRAPIVRQRLDAIGRIIKPDRYADLLFHLSPFLTKTELDFQLQEMLTWLQRWTESELSKVAYALKTLVPLMSEPLLSDALAMTRKLKHDWHVDEALSIFAKRLAETGNYQTALEVVKESDAHLQPALMYVIPHLPNALLSEAMDLARNREYALAELYGRLAANGESKKATAQAEQLKWPNTRAAARLAVAPYLSAEEQSQWLQEALTDMLQIEAAEIRRELLERCAPLLAQCTKPTLATLWCKALSSLSKRTRKDSFTDLLLLTPALIALAGEKGADEVFRAIRDAIRWWP